MGFNYITNHSSPNYTRWVRNRPTKIVIHHWGKTGQAFMGVVRYLCQRRVKVGAHFVVENNRVACLINPTKRAWHAGPGNYNTIGIECRPEATRADLETLAELVAVLWHWYPALKGRSLLYHSFFMNTACPGQYKKHLAWLRERAWHYYPLVDAKHPGGITRKVKPNVHKPKKIRLPKKTNTTQDVIDRLAKDVIKGKYGNGTTRKQKLGDKYAPVQARVNELLRHKTRAKPNYVAMAKKVLRGEYGNGEARKQKLGPHYYRVQRIVNQMLKQQ